MKKTIFAAFAAISVVTSTPAQSLTPEEARAIAKEAYIYGFPLVDNYRVQYSYFVDKSGREYKGSWNEINNTARLVTPDDKAIQMPILDTPYSRLGADLRAEPLVISVPEIENGRYYSAQFIDMQTYNFAYVGSRSTGNGAGTFLLAGPHWHGEMPPGVKQLIRSECDFDFVLFRTQLFNPGDIENVKKVQAGYKVEPLSRFLGQPAPPTPAPVDWIKSLEFFSVLNFVLQFCPTHPSETELMDKFGKIGIGAGKTFDMSALPPEIRKAVRDGMVDGWDTFKEFKETEIDTGKIAIADGFGTREALNGNYLFRMAAAVLGIYSNSKEEAMYPAYFVDAENKPLNGLNRYRLRFGAGRLPPVNAFWSLMLYELPGSLLNANPLNRYLINSPMLSSLKRDADGGITLYVQHESPGADVETNWLPAPSGSFFMAMQLYWPKLEALNGSWAKPPLERVN